MILEKTRKDCWEIIAPRMQTETNMNTFCTERSNWYLKQKTKLSCNLCDGGEQ